MPIAPESDRSRRVSVDAGGDCIFPRSTAIIPIFRKKVLLGPSLVSRRRTASGSNSGIRLRIFVTV